MKKVGIRHARLSAAVLAVISGASMAHGQSVVTWDPSATIPPTDGSGNWDTITPQWYDPSSNMVVPWNNSTPDTAVFGSTTSTITAVNGTQNLVTLTTNLNVQDFILGTATDGSALGYYNFADIGDGNETLTLNGNLIKASAVGKSVFQLSAPIVLPAGNHVVAINDTTTAVPELSMEEYNDNSLTGPGSITLNNAYNSSGYTAYGTFVLDTDNTYTGNTDIEDGALTANASNAMGTTGTVTIGNKGALEFGGQGTTQPASLTISNPIVITRNTYTGVDYGDYTDAITSTNSGAGAGAVVTFNSPSFVIDSTNAQIAADTSTIIINSNITNGTDVAAGVLTLDGDFAGYVTLNGDNRGLTGGINLIGGVELNASNINNIGGATATLNFNGSATFHPVGGFISNFGTLNVNYSTFSGGIDIDAGQSFTINQNLGTSGNTTGSVGNRGLGTLNLGGTDILGGTTYWDSGTVNVTGTLSLGSLHLRSPVVSITGIVNTTSGYSSFGQDTETATPDSATVSLSGSGQLNLANADFNVSDNAHTFGSLTLSNTSEVTAGGNSYFGKSVGATSLITLNDSSTYQANGSVNIGTASTALGSLTLNNSSVFTVNGSVNAALATGGTASITLNGSSLWNVKTTLNLGGGGGNAYLALNNTSTLTVGNQFFIGGGTGGGAGTITAAAGTTINANKTGQQSFAIGGGTNGAGYVTNNGATITVAGEFWDGNNGGSKGNYTQTAGSLTAKDWFVVGRSGANGTLDLSGGTITKQGANSAYIGENSGVSTMTVEGTGTYAQTVGTFNIGNTSASNGTLIIQATGIFNDTSTGTFTDATAGSTGTLDVYGSGSFTQANGTLDIAEGAAANGTVNVQGSGSLTDTSGQVWVGDGNATANATVNISGGIFGAVNNWLAVGRNAGHGTINVQGGTLEKLGANFLSIGSGTSGNGTVNETSGTINSDATLIGESGTGFLNLTGGTATLGALQDGYANNGSATLTIGGTALVSASSFTIGTANAATGIVNLNTGGSFTVPAVVKGTSTGATTFNFNGGTLAPSASTASFMSGLTTANVLAGGAVINTNTDSIGISQPLVHASSLGATPDGGLKVSGGGTLTLGGVDTYTGGTTVTGATLVASVAGSLPSTALNIGSAGTVQLAANTGLQQLTSLGITGGSTLDLTNNHVIINYGSGPDPISSIAALIQSGYNGDTWTGTGITSTTAAANAGSYGIGYADGASGVVAGLSSGQIEIMYTLLGDANLDHKVNGDDFTLMATNFNDLVTNGWDEGDFNYSNTVNGDDFVLLANNFNQFASQSDVTAADLTALDNFAAANGISLTSVPEPASIGMLALGSVCMLRRRRRKV